MRSQRPSFLHPFKAVRFLPTERVCQEFAVFADEFDWMRSCCLRGIEKLAEREEMHHRKTSLFEQIHRARIVVEKDACGMRHHVLKLAKQEGAVATRLRKVDQLFHHKAIVPFSDEGIVEACDKFLLTSFLTRLTDVNIRDFPAEQSVENFAYLPTGDYTACYIASHKVYVWSYGCHL